MARRAVTSKLGKYRSKRDFQVTSEPSGGRSPRAAGNSFVIQKHAARRLHYDFRLELDGVLLSWSVPKGPSLSPAERRLAVRVEDHPLDYADFEGIIPPGQYGGGTVAVWDRGTWQPEGDPRDAMRRGRLTFTLKGEKLHGKWHLVRTRPQGKQEGWLLFKGRDEAANDNVDIVESEPRSVISHRTIDQIAKDADRVWQSSKSTATPGDVAALVKQLPLGFPLTNLDKVLYPEQGITKAQLIAYLAVVADWMLPQLKERPLTLVRCPEGRHKPCFFQKKILPGSPKSIGTVAIEEEDGDVVEYMKVKDMPGLVGLAQLGTLEIHTWGCHADKVERPDLMVFDLDPDPQRRLGPRRARRVRCSQAPAQARPRQLRQDDRRQGTSCLRAGRSGRSRGTSFKAFTKAFADTMASEEPKQYTSNISKAARKGKIFVDYLRNGRNATFIAPYSPRAREGAPVAMPITWEELAHGVDPASFTTSTVPARLAKRAKDPWDGIDDADQAITAAAWRALGGKP